MRREAEFSIANSAPRLAFCPCRNWENEKTLDDSSSKAKTSLSTFSVHSTISACTSSALFPAWSSGSVDTVIVTRNGPSLANRSAVPLGTVPDMDEPSSTDWYPRSGAIPPAICPLRTPSSADLLSLSLTSDCEAPMTAPNSSWMSSPASIFGNQSEGSE